MGTIKEAIWFYLTTEKILVDNKTVYLHNWVENDVISIKDLLKADGNYLSFQEFTDT